jgi:hypothetical protein
LAAGAAVGKLLQGLSGGIQDMQKNMVANKLMNTEDAPRAALVSAPGGGGDGGPQPAAGDTSDGVDPSADLSTDLPEDVSTAAPSVQVPPDTINNPGIANQQTVPGTGGTYSGANTDDTLSSGVAAARLNAPAPASRISAADWSKQNPGVSVLGTPKHTGGTDEMALQKEMLAMRLSKSGEARANAEEARAVAKEADPIAKAQKLLELRKTQAEIDKANRPEKPDKNAPPENVDSEPVRDTDQLGNYVNTQYGNGVYEGLVKAASSSSNSDSDLAQVPSEPDTKDAQGRVVAGAPRQLFQSNPDGSPKYNSDGTRAINPGAYVTIPMSEANALTGEPKKSVNMPLKEARTLFGRLTCNGSRMGCRLSGCQAKSRMWEAPRINRSSPTTIWKSFLVSQALG